MGQLKEIWVELSAMLYADLEGLLAIGDNTNVGTFWASFVSDPRVPDARMAYWIGIGSSAYVVEQVQIAEIVESCKYYLDKVQNEGWSSFGPVPEREPIGSAFQKWAEQEDV